MSTQADQSAFSTESNHMKTCGRLQALAPGQITPTGWLGRYAEINANAWLLHYARNEDPEVYGKFFRPNRNARATAFFSENNETLVLSDYTAYFADGMMHYAALFPESELARRATPWIDQLLESQDPDGYIGAFQPQVRWQNGLDVFSQCVTLEAVLFRYECTGDRRLLAACERAVHLQMATWYRPGPEVKLDIWSGHGTIAIRALLKLYALSGDIAYLQFARDVMARFGRTQEFLKGGDALMHHHNAVGSEHVGFPASLYEYTGDPALLEASRAAWEMLAQHHLSVDGTPHGNEIMQFKGPLHNCEHCGTVEWFYTSNVLARVAGEVRFADAAERAMLNAYPAAKSPDGMAVAYMHTPNQLVASEWSQPHGWTSPDWCASRQHYHSAHEPLCCNSNGPRGLAYFIESMVMRARTGLAVVYYGPCHVHTRVPGAGKVVALRMDTDYPFEDEVTITVTPEERVTFDLFLRIPAWCRGATIAVNGQAWPGPVSPGDYACVQRHWQPGDRVTLRFDYPLHYERWERSEFGVRAGGVAVLRGPLTYALPVQEEWQPFEPPARGPGKGVVAYRVLPRTNAPWNYALVLHHPQPEENFTLVSLPVPPDRRPWECAPIGLQVKARKVLNWHIQGEPEHPVTPGLPFNPVALGDEETDITLVPFGCTHLRMTYLPVA
ncbi:MAG: glycoside hydrolase family 127 protein [Chloroflexi bacterium]|nr:glycoside hydrolase family 127 protein [Chloroflexota bacterium]